VVLLYEGIAEGRLDAPQAEQHGALDADLALDAREEQRMVLRALLAGLDACARSSA
jgi:hypothetical protein